MLTPDYLLRISEGAEDIAEELHISILRRIIRRMMERIGRGEEYLVTATDKWNIQVLQDAGYLLEDIQKDIQKYTGLQADEIKQAFEDAGITALQYDDAVYRAAGLSPVPLMESPYLVRLMQRNCEATLMEWENYTRTTASNAQRAFIQAVDKAYNLTTSGAVSYTEAVKEAVDELAEKGITTVEYTRTRKPGSGESTAVTPTDGKPTEKTVDGQKPTGIQPKAPGTTGQESTLPGTTTTQGAPTAPDAPGKEYVHHTDTIETATLRAVRTGVSQAAGDIVMQRMVDMDWDTILVSAHIGARMGDGGENPGNHYWWQGKYYSRTGRDDRFPPFSVTGYGTGEGLCGWNCRHSFGVGTGEESENPYEKIDSDKNREAERLNQRQRALERAIRKTKREVLALREAIDSAKDEKLKYELDLDYQRKAYRLQKQNKAYDDFCKENGLKKRSDRVAIAKWDRQQAASARGAAKRYSGK